MTYVNYSSRIADLVDSYLDRNIEMLKAQANASKARGELIQALELDQYEESTSHEAVIAVRCPRGGYWIITPSHQYGVEISLIEEHQPVLTPCRGIGEPDPCSQRENCLRYHAFKTASSNSVDFPNSMRKSEDMPCSNFIPASDSDA